MEKGRHYLRPMKTNRQQALLTKIESSFVDILDALGVNFQDGNFTDTPSRCARALINDFIAEPFTLSDFEDEPYDGMITLPCHEVQTRCPHHLERVQMIVAVSYVPRGDRIVGLSKLGRLANYMAKGCILQETYTRLLADEIMDHLEPEGCGVYTRAKHQCMQCRGVQTRSPVAMKVLRGIYLHSPQTREEFLREIFASL